MWQPIETAPKDGRHMIVLCGRVMIGYFDPDESRWLQDDGSKWGRSLPYNPSHWMPLPNPPAQEEG